MDWYKASPLAYYRDMLNKMGPDVAKKARAGLDADTVRLFDTCLPMTWVNVLAADRILQGVALAAHPGNPEGTFLLGRRLARDTMSTVYKVLLSVTTIPFAVKQTARLWGTFHRRGTAVTVREGDAKEATMVVSGYPEFPEVVRQNVAGFVTGILDLTGAANPHVQHDGSNPEAWRFEARWS
jgi:hypothetical protein